MFSVVSGRATSAFPLSVGTSLAFESLVKSNKPSIDPDRRIPQVINLTDYDEIWINVSTLYRNLIGSLTKDDSARVHSGEVAMGLMQEMDVIKEIVAENTFDKVQVIFYVCDYSDINNRKYPHAILRESTTKNQLINDARRNDSINEVLKQKKNLLNIRLFKSELKTTQFRKAIIISHVAHDLLSHVNFSQLDLLESHTGVLKKKHQFNTKYTDGKNYPMLPFNKTLLQVFGDSEHFKAYPMKIRDVVINVAEKYKWTSATTDDKIRYSFSQISDIDSKATLLKLI